MRYEYKSIYIYPSDEPNVKLLSDWEKEHPGWKRCSAGIPHPNGGVQWNFKREIPGTKLLSEMTEDDLRKIIREELDSRERSR